ncbi:MFS transporter [Antrihabitans stalactiti]|uniref:NarK/NasA family nitrate transporter n=1 Tax=Antrihabitans stalactiti TaxID=2584121 RepID=A0A848KFW6_9NOCA|nr:NarK/NasA family nitrate transporter [Antrihabitans stalactiti]
MTTQSRKRWIEDWDSEDVAAWEAGGKKIAKRNLIFSIFAEHVGFSVWSIWSVMVLFMPQNVYHIDAAGKFFLLAVPTLVGSILRIPYTVATAKFGGRNWTIFSAVALLVPAALTLYFVQHPETSYTTFLIVAAFAGLGGGNFASSMTNINAFYPQRLKGWALGLNAGGGNIGVPAMQIIGLLVIAFVSKTSPEIVCAIYLVLCGLAAVGAAIYMDNLANQQTTLKYMTESFKFSHTWVMAFLYIGTFGSFIGFSFAFGQVLNINFVASGQTAPQAVLHAAQIAWLGPLLGSISRPFGGKLSDKIGGGKVTLFTFVLMMVSAGVLVTAGIIDDNDGRPGASGAVLVTYIVAFIALFILSGIGNGSTYKMIPSIFEAKSKSLEGKTRLEQAAWSRNMSGALIGFAGAIGAFGGVLINLVLRQSYLGADKSATSAFMVFAAFYVVCAIVTWAVFLRTPSPKTPETVEATPAVTGESDDKVSVSV